MNIDLNAIEETLMGPLWSRAKLSREHNSLLNDIKAIELIEQIDYDFSTFDRELSFESGLVYAARAKQFDDKIKAYIMEHPNASIVNIGAGLDTTFYRIDNGTIHWYDLDLPNVIAIRKQLLQEPDRTTYISKSLFDKSWCKEVKHTEDGVFMIAGGVLMYFKEEQVKQFLSLLADNLSGGEIIFDSTSKLSVVLSNLTLWRMGMEGVNVKWALKDANEIKKWDARIKVMEQFSYFRGIPRDPAWGEEIKTWMDLIDEIKILNIFHVSV